MNSFSAGAGMAVRPRAEAPKGTFTRPRSTELKKEQLSQGAVKAALSLKQRGWASLEGVLTREECQDYEAGFWNWMEGLGTGVKKDNPTTWQYPAWPPSFRGIINSLEVAHQAFVWRVRRNPRLLKIFADLWGSDALLSSFDSINALPATAEPPSESWLHVDQAPHRRGIACIQGLVNLVDVGPETTGTLLVKDGSHEAHHSFFEEISKMTPEEQAVCIDHYKFTPEELSYWDKYESIGVPGSAGSLFLWDSRAVHANVFPKATSEMRHVVYTCYQPASMASASDKAQKKAAYEQYRLTTHWPAMNIRLYDDDSAVEYYGAEGQSDKPRYQITRTRDSVEDHTLMQLGGAMAYMPEEASERPALLDMTEEELQSLL